MSIITPELRKVIQNPSHTELCHLMNQYKSDKGYYPGSHHTYTPFYHTLFSKFKNNPINILEIGIGTIDPKFPSSMVGAQHGYQPGASIRGWRDYFTNAVIYTCDIDKEVLKLDLNNVHTFFMDQTRPETIKKVIQEGVLKDIQLDIVIDDGLHKFDTNVSVMNLLLPVLKENGYYIIEDVLNYQYNPKLVQNLPYECEYITLPNPKNNVDNNLFVLQKKIKSKPDNVQNMAIDDLQFV